MKGATLLYIHTGSRLFSYWNLKVFWFSLKTIPAFPTRLIEGLEFQKSVTTS
jgi:hypothetical protein